MHEESGNVVTRRGKSFLGPNLSSRLCGLI
jgi:hypothetical protein